MTHNRDITVDLILTLEDHDRMVMFVTVLIKVEKHASSFDGAAAKVALPAPKKNCKRSKSASIKKAHTSVGLVFFSNRFIIGQLPSTINWLHT